MFDSSTAPQQPKMQWQLWRSSDIRHKMQKNQLELQMHIHPCHYKSQTVTLTCQWLHTARKHLQRARRRRPWSNKTGEFTLPPNIRPNGKYIRGLQRRRFSVPGMCGEKTRWQPTLPLSKFRQTRNDWFLSVLINEKNIRWWFGLSGQTVMSARSVWLTLPHLLLPLSRPP